MIPPDPFDDGARIDSHGVERSKDKRPYIYIRCPDRCPGGRVPGKRPGTTKQCPKCHGQGVKRVLYTRCTTFVAVLESRDAIEKWRSRLQLAGLRLHPNLLDRIDEVLLGQLAAEQTRAELNSIAEAAFQAGDVLEKAQQGTNLHTLSEYVDSGRPLPEVIFDDGKEWPVTLQDRADMGAWRRVVELHRLKMLDSELFVVNDEFGIGGTFDRLASQDLPRDHPLRICPLCDRPNIWDLKTGRTDYGQGKIAQQEAVYAHSQRYDPELAKTDPEGARSELGACPHFGGVIHLPQGTGSAEVQRANLLKGWEAVRLSSEVREHRRVSKDWLQTLDGIAQAK
jgi:hypothetical protein